LLVAGKVAIISIVKVFGAFGATTPFFVLSNTNLPTHKKVLLKYIKDNNFIHVV